MTFKIQPCDLRNDAEAVATLISSRDREPLRAATLLDERSYLPEGSLCHDLKVEHEGRLVGYANIYRYPNTLPGKVYVQVVVAREAERQGIGNALYEQLLSIAQHHGATLLVGPVRDDLPETMAWLERRGCFTRHHSYLSVLELATIEANRFEGVVDGVRASGITFHSLAEGMAEELLEQLYRLYERTMVDVPGYEASAFMSRGVWRKLVLENQGARPEWVIYAADGEQLVGVTTLVHRDAATLYTNHTLVHLEYRGRRIALALKLLALQAAQQYGAMRLTTGNSSANGPMLAVNRRLGYQPLAGYYEVALRLK